MGVGEARRFVLSRCRLPEPRWTALSEAAGCVLADPVRSFEDVPAFTRSAMDGYALRSGDIASVPRCLHVVDTLMAGDEPAVRVGAGEAVRIMTGAPLPEGADAVCKIEMTRTDDSEKVVVVDESVARGTNVRYAPARTLRPGWRSSRRGRCLRRLT